MGFVHTSHAKCGHTTGKITGGGPDQIPSWLVFKILMKACLNSAKIMELIFW